MSGYLMNQGIKVYIYANFKYRGIKSNIVYIMIELRSNGRDKKINISSYRLPAKR